MPRDAAAKPAELLRSVLTQSSVVDRLSSRLGQLVNVVSGLLPEHRDHDVERAGFQTQCECQDRVPNYILNSHDRVHDSHRSVPSGAETTEDEMPLDTVRATFPPGKRRLSCIADTITTSATDKAETGKIQPEERKIGAGVTWNVAQLISTSVGQSSSFDLGMTQPGSLASWRLTSERVRVPESDQHPLSDTVSSYCSGSDYIGMTTASDGSRQPLPSLAENQSETSTVGVASTTRQQVDDPSTLRHAQQQQQQSGVPLQQSRRRSEVLASSAWYRSSRARRRWSEVPVVVPGTPPCSPASPDLFNRRFTPGETFTAGDSTRRRTAEARADTRRTTAAIDDDQRQVHSACEQFKLSTLTKQATILLHSIVA